MTTIVVVKKNRQIAIASDALVTFGETRLPHGYEVNDKIFHRRKTTPIRTSHRRSPR